MLRASVVEELLMRDPGDGVAPFESLQDAQRDVQGVGFEPTRISPRDLKSLALTNSAILASGCAERPREGLPQPIHAPRF